MNRPCPLPSRAWAPALGCLLLRLLWSVVPEVGVVDGQTEIQGTFCSGRGMVNTNLTCSCFSGFRGPDCSLRYCPTGRAWTDFPSADNVAHADGVECSNMGTCHRTTGLCNCRTGFAGQACDRLECPSDCSGHGKCLSMAEAASGWDGRVLVRPNVEYTSIWDADILHGCVCDSGWIGHDCSQLECPKGDDPLTTGQHNEVLRIVCQANSGSFVLSFRGVASAAISFNSSYGYVEELLENMDSITDVDVSISGEGSSVCGQDNEAVTEVEFMQDFGDLPAALVSSDDLQYAGGDARLYLETTSEIVCPACPSCTGGVYMIYDDETTSSIPSDASSADIEAQLLALDTFGSASVYGNITSINVTMEGGSNLCDSVAQVNTHIKVRCAYGNLPSFTLINSVRDSDGSPVSISITDGNGNKENEYCSNHGVCDFSTGTCLCDRNTTNFPDNWYWWESSDGYGGSGKRPGCGHQRLESITNATQTCPVGVVSTDESSPTYKTMGQVLCSGQGTCNEATGGCICNPDFYGGGCSQRQCPTGKAWFDEAYADNAAHAYGMECGAMGNCDHGTGDCICRDGWTGAACGRLACADDCSEHGACLPMYRLAQLRESNGEADAGTYGTTDLVRPGGVSVYANPSTWDFDMMYGCLCDSGERAWDDGDGFNGGVFRPRTGTRGYISGVFTDNSKLSGWDGYMCSQRTCPTGNNPQLSSGTLEVQTVTCTLNSGYFTTSFRGAATEAIDATATESEIAAAIGHIPTIGSVSISYTSGDTACNSTWAEGEGIQITFLTELGDLPSVSTSPPFGVNKTTTGSKENAECSGNGICDFGKGECTCLDGWASSDGNGGTGDRGDCGYHNAFCIDSTHVELTAEETFALLIAAAQAAS